MFANLLVDAEGLINKRDDLHKQIVEEEEEKRKLENDLRILAEHLAKVNESLTRKILARNEYDKAIAETEHAYMKVRVFVIQSVVSDSHCKRLCFLLVVVIRPSDNCVADFGYLADITWRVKEGGPEYRKTRTKPKISKAITNDVLATFIDIA